MGEDSHTLTPRLLSPNRQPSTGAVCVPAKAPGNPPSSHDIEASSAILFLLNYKDGRLLSSLISTACTCHQVCVCVCTQPPHPPIPSQRVVGISFYIAMVTNVQADE